MNAAAWNIEIDWASSHGVGVSNRLAQGTRAGVVGVYDSKNKRRRRLMRFRWVPRDCGVWCSRALNICGAGGTRCSRRISKGRGEYDRKDRYEGDDQCYSECKSGCWVILFHFVLWGEISGWRAWS